MFLFFFKLFISLIFTFRYFSPTYYFLNIYFQGLYDEINRNEVKFNNLNNTAENLTSQLTNCDQLKETLDKVNQHWDITMNKMNSRKLGYVLFFYFLLLYLNQLSGCKKTLVCLSYLFLNSESIEKLPNSFSLIYPNLFNCRKLWYVLFVSYIRIG